MAHTRGCTQRYGEWHVRERPKPKITPLQSFDALVSAFSNNAGAGNGTAAAAAAGTEAGAAEMLLPVAPELARAAEAVVRSRGRKATAADDAAAAAAAASDAATSEGAAAAAAQQRGTGDAAAEGLQQPAVAPTPVQAAVWGSIFGETPADIVAVSFTGSGKTLAFALPCLATIDKCYPPVDPASLADASALKPQPPLRDDGGDPVDPKIAGRDAAAAVFVRQVKAGVPKLEAKKAAKAAYDKAAAAARDGTHHIFIQEQAKALKAAEQPPKPRGWQPPGSLAQPCVAVLAPTRELGQQIALVFEGLIAELPPARRIPSMCVVGGQDLVRQRQEMLATQPLVLIATPGRLLTLCGKVPESTRTRQTQAADETTTEDGTEQQQQHFEPVCTLSKVAMFVLDEADRLLDLGFEEDVVAVSRLIGVRRPRTLMLSATWGEATFNLASTMLSPGAVHIQVGGAGLQAAHTVTQRVEVLRGKGAPRFRRLWMLLAQYQAEFAVADDRDAKAAAAVEAGGVDADGAAAAVGDDGGDNANDGDGDDNEGGADYGSDDDGAADAQAAAARPKTAAKILVFVLYKKEARDVAKSLQEKGFAVAAIQGDMSQTARQGVLDRFRAGEVDVLVGTDVAARGLDVTGVTHVINFSVGLSIDNYVRAAFAPCYPTTALTACVEKKKTKKKTKTSLMLLG